MKTILSAFILFTIIININAQNSDIHKIIAKEVIQVSKYTYILGEENDSIQWLAVPTVDAKAGKTYYYKGGMQMGKFHSKELNRTFDNITFLASINSL